jgi:hypothetical protein
MRPFAYARPGGRIVEGKVETISFEPGSMRTSGAGERVRLRVAAQAQRS